MLRLPKTLSPEIRRVYQAALQSPALTEVLPGLAEGTRELFGAQEAFLVFDAEGREQAICAFEADSQGFYEGFNEAFWQSWKKAGVHERLTKDLLLRLSAISYSNFSWPYARVQVERDLVRGERYQAPRDYSILLPISSDIIVRAKGEEPFFGYVALFFAVFPQISDEVVQLIITLPQLLSEIVASCMRQDLE